MKNFKNLRTLFNLTQIELSKRLHLDNDTIAMYEAGKITPSFKTLKKFVTFYNVSFDFFIQEDTCKYPRNLELLRLAKKIDGSMYSNKKSHIVTSIKSFLGKKYNEKIEMKQDLVEIKLTDNFHSNLKIIRKHKDITQLELAQNINVTRPVIGMYESKNYPQIETLIKLSNFLNISIHALTTGEKLDFNFNDGNFGKIILLADRLLTFEYQKMIIILMNASIDNC